MLKCFAQNCCSAEVTQEKLIGLYTRRSSHKKAGASALGHQINTQSRVKTAVSVF